MKSKGLLPVLLFLAIFISDGTAWAGPIDNWHWRNPLPNGNPIPAIPTYTSVVFTNGFFVAVGISGVVGTSPDGTNWTQQVALATNTLNTVIYAQGKYVALGTKGMVQTSVDATNWVIQNSGTTNSLNSVAYAHGKFVAVGGSVIITSPDAVNWSTVAGTTGALAVAGSSAGFVAVGGNPQVYYSADGSTWTTNTLTAPGNVFHSNALLNESVTFYKGAFLINSFRFSDFDMADTFVFRSTDGINWTTNVLGTYATEVVSGFYYNFITPANGFAMIGGFGALTAFFQYSTDGITWNTTNAAPENYFGPSMSCAYGNGSYVAVTEPIYGPFGAPQIMVSQDGVNWTNVNLPLVQTGPAYNFTSIAFTNGIYVAGSSNGIARSTDGLVYTNVSSAPVLPSVMVYSSGFIGVGPGGNLYVSTDGQTWTQRNAATASNLHGIAYGNGLLVAVGDGGAIQTSTAGTVWTSRSSGTTLALYGITYGNGLFVAVGKLGTVVTSPDGVSWTGQYSGQTLDLDSVAYGYVGFAAVGASGTIVTSLDATNWTVQTSGTAQSLQSVTFADGYYLTDGANGTVLTSADGSSWTSRQVGLTGGQNLYGASFVNGRFAVTGASGTIIASDTIAPLFALNLSSQRGTNVFELFITPGSTFRLQTASSLAPASWSDLNTFNNAAGVTWWTNTTSGFNQRFFRGISP